MGNQNAGAAVTSMTKCSPQKLIRQPMGFYTPTSRIIDCRSLWARRDENSTLSTRKMWRSVSQWVMIGPEKPIECGQPWTCSATCKNTCKNTFVEQRLYRSKNKLSISAHDKREKSRTEKVYQPSKFVIFHIAIGALSVSRTIEPETSWRNTFFDNSTKHDGHRRNVIRLIRLRFDGFDNFAV